MTGLNTSMPMIYAQDSIIMIPCIEFAAGFAEGQCGDGCGGSNILNNPHIHAYIHIYTYIYTGRQFEVHIHEMCAGTNLRSRKGR